MHHDSIHTVHRCGLFYIFNLLPFMIAMNAQTLSSVVLLRSLSSYRLTFMAAFIRCFSEGLFEAFTVDEFDATEKSSSFLMPLFAHFV